MNVKSVCHSYDAKEASSVFKTVHSDCKGVCVSSTFNTGPQYREVKGTSCVVIPKKHHTKCFYNSHMDKKQIIGLLARGNKAKQLMNKGVKIPTKIYRPTNKASIVSGANTVHGASSEGTCDMSLHGDGGFTPRSHSDECVNECVHIQDNRNNDFPVQGERVGIVDTDTNTYYHDNDNEKQVQTVGVSMSVDQVVKVFDINTTGDDKYLNTLLSKQVVMRIKGNEYLQCDVFRKWREQTDFDFGFVPLSPLVLPH